MSAEMPLVSILIPGYKAQHFELALTSALAQVYPNREIIVSDDCPTGAIEAVCARYPDVQYSRNPEPGVARNILRLVGLANGVYLKFLFDDDLLQPLCISRMVQAFASAQNVTLAFSPRDIIDADNRIINRPRYFKVKGDSAVISGGALRRHCLLRVRNHIGEFSTVMFRKQDVLDENGQAAFFEFHGVPVVGLGDIGTFLKLLEKGDAAFISDPLSYFRMHKASNTGQTGSPLYRAAVSDWVIFARHVYNHPDFSPADKRLSLENTKLLLASKLALFPDLVAELVEVEKMQTSLAAAGG